MSHGHKHNTLWLEKDECFMNSLQYTGLGNGAVHSYHPSDANVNAYQGLRTHIYNYGGIITGRHHIPRGSSKNVALLINIDDTSGTVRLKSRFQIEDDSFKSVKVDGSAIQPWSLFHAWDITEHDINVYLSGDANKYCDELNHAYTNYTIGSG